MKLFCSVCLLLLGICSTLAQTPLHDQLTVALTHPSKEAYLEVNLVYGSIHITGYDGPTIVIDATSSSPLPDRSPSSTGGAMKPVGKANPLGLLADEENNRIRLRTNSASMPVNLTIKVPRQTSLNVRTYDKGDIVIENVLGDLEVDNTNGSIQLRRVGGSVVANTYKGRLAISLQTSGSPKQIALSSMGGQIDLTYPTGIKASLKVKSVQGNVFSDVDLTKNGAQTVRTTQAGRTTSTLDDWLYGKINGGGPLLTIQNYLGDVHLKKAN